MFGTGKVAQGIQGRLQHAGSSASGMIARRSFNERALKRSLHPTTRQQQNRLTPVTAAAPAAATKLRHNPSVTRAAGYCTTASVADGRANGKAVPMNEDLVHKLFLSCLDKGDANAAMAHFAFISCAAKERGLGEAGRGGEAGQLFTLRRRQLLVLLCEKGMVKEASELLTKATASPEFDSRDSSTIASFMYVMGGCLNHKDVDGALLHFHQASERGMGLALPICESLATDLFIKGLRGEGPARETAEREAWNVLEYIRQRGMVHRPEVCEHALLWAMASADLSFALRVCQHVDDEGMVIEPDLRDALFRAVGYAIKGLPDTAAINVNSDAVAGVHAATTRPDAAAALAGESEGATSGGGDWKVEGTNATVEELWTLDALLQSWLDAEMDDLDEEDEYRDGVDDDHDEGVELDYFDVSAEAERDEREVGARDDSDEEFDSAGSEWNTNAVGADGGDGETTITVDGMDNVAEDVVDFDDDDEDDTAGGATGGKKTSATDSTPSGSTRTETVPEGRTGGEGDYRPGAPCTAKSDYGGDRFCGDLVDQMSESNPEYGGDFFEMGGVDYDFPGGGDGGEFRWDRSGGGRRGERGHRGLDRRSVFADLVMPYGDPHEEGGQGILTIPVQISVEGNDDDEDDDDDDDDSNGGGGGVIV